MCFWNCVFYFYFVVLLCMYLFYFYFVVLFYVCICFAGCEYVFLYVLIIFCYELIHLFIFMFGGLILNNCLFCREYWFGWLVGEATWNKITHNGIGLGPKNRIKLCWKGYVIVKHIIFILNRMIDTLYLISCEWLDEIMNGTVTFGTRIGVENDLTLKRRKTSWDEYISW